MRNTDTIHHTDGIGMHLDRAPREQWDRPSKTAVVCTDLFDNEILCPDGLRTYTIGSVVSYALKCGDDPVAAIDRARQNGHELVYIFGNAAVLSAGQRTPEPVIRVTIGMVVRFQGNFYTIEKAPNQNLRLQAYVPAAAVEVA